MDVSDSKTVYWRVEGSLLNLSTVRPVAFFAWNAQTFTERWLRRGAIFLQALLRPFLYACDRVFATRVVHTMLRGISRDRLDLLGEEYFHYVLKSQLKSAGVEALRAACAQGDVVLVSQGLEHVMRPLAQHLGVDRLIANHLEFRDGYATGRLLEPVIRPRGALARLTGGSPNGQRSWEQLLRDLGLERRPELVSGATMPARRQVSSPSAPAVSFDHGHRLDSLSVRESLAGKQLLMIGVTGFIGKVWLAQILERVPQVGRIYLLVRRQKSTSAQRRFERIIEESPLFDPLAATHGERLARFISEKVEVVEGDAGKPDLGIAPEVLRKLRSDLDVVINSSGLTDFNPDLRDALASNVNAVLNVVEFVRGCDHAGLLHLSTCYVAGARDGRVPEKLTPNYVPCAVPNFDAEKELQSLWEMIGRAEQYSESAELGEKLRRQALTRRHAARDLHGTALEHQIRKNRIRWLKTHLTQAGMRRARELGWPNTYTFSKSLAESLVVKHAAGLRVAVVRPAIVETSIADPFQGWNEGINTSASLSYLLGTYFRQLPSNGRKRLDIVPVDTVCRGMTLVAAALVRGVHDPLYQLATSVSNPCDMARSIELTCLAHRRYYRAQNGLEHQFKMRFDTIPVSKERYNRLSAPAQKAIIKSLQKVTGPFPFLQPPLVRSERGLERVEKLIELFEPFILHNEHDFEAENVEKLSRALPPEEQADFAYDTRSLDWYEYWINIHIPALRKWTYPLIESRPPEVRARRSFRLSGEASGNPALAREAGEAVKTGTGDTWRYS
jgi:thioester reductase-like protein/phosphoserine phosphatase